MDDTQLKTTPAPPSPINDKVYNACIYYNPNSAAIIARLIECGAHVAE